MAETYAIDAPAVPLTAGTAKTAMIASAASTQPFRLILLSVSCDAVATGLLKVEYLVGTISGGTAGTAPYKSRANEAALAKTPLTASTGLYTVEPTWTKYTNNDFLTVKTLLLPLPTSPFEILYPLGREHAVPVSTSLGIRLTATTVSPNAYVHIQIEE